MGKGSVPVKNENRDPSPFASFAALANKSDIQF
jgi:hypothetical protein